MTSVTALIQIKGFEETRTVSIPVPDTNSNNYLQELYYSLQKLQAEVNGILTKVVEQEKADKLINATNAYNNAATDDEDDEDEVGEEEINGPPDKKSKSVT